MSHQPGYAWTEGLPERDKFADIEHILYCCQFCTKGPWDNCKEIVDLDDYAVSRDTLGVLYLTCKFFKDKTTGDE